MLVTLYFGILSIFILFFLRQNFERQATKAIADKAQSIAQITAFSISPALFFEDTTSIKTDILSLLQTRDIAYIVVANSAGEIIADYNRTTADNADYIDIQPDKMKSPDGKIYKVTAPILASQHEIGRLYLGFSLIQIRREIVRSSLAIIFVTLIIFFISTIAVFAISSVVTRPLERMVRTVQQVAQGDLTQRVAIASRDEVGNLSASFNTMIEALEKSMKELKQENTQRKEAEARVNKLNEELEQRVNDRTKQLEASNRELEGFVYSVSHDLRAPIRHTLGFIDLLKKLTFKQVDETAQRYMTNIYNASIKLGTLIDDLLVYSRIGRTEMNKKPVDLNQIIKEVLNEAKPDYENRKITWKISELERVSGDATLLRQVMINLISNAIKFTRRREQATIEIGNGKSQPGEIVVLVRDNGVGFDMRYLDKLFGVFQRLHHTEDFEGTGIGLANVKRIIELHGGRVWAEGTVDVGATFYFALPRA